ncbi:MAG: TlpA family protein disulfide reductase [Planctomycetes bacterium]|nr:TlpA family protein disulfide reductase [Planctomycetota bacterium]
MIAPKARQRAAKLAWVLIAAAAAPFVGACSSGEDPTAAGDSGATAAAASTSGAASPTASATATTPSVSVVDLAGLDAALAQHRGRGVLLNFWAIWCAPCVAELPELLEVGREFADQGGDVVLVSYDAIVPGATREQAEHDVLAFAERRKITAPILIYDAPDEEAINARFDLPGGVPVTLAIDRDGKVVATHDGQASKDEFRALMRQALAR